MNNDLSNTDIISTIILVDIKQLTFLKEKEVILYYGTSTRNTYMIKMKKISKRLLICKVAGSSA